MIMVQSLLCVRGLLVLLLLSALLMVLTSCFADEPNIDINDGLDLELNLVDDLNFLPIKCRRYVDEILTAENPSRDMANMQLESGCDEFAQSWAGAKSLYQFMPDTHDWLSVTHCKDLVHYPYESIEFQHRCFTAYSATLEVDYGIGACDNLFTREQRYHGGYWVVWERDAFDGTLDGGKSMCGHVLPNGRMRSKKNCIDNYEYPFLIATRQIKYASIGGQLCLIER